MNRVVIRRGARADVSSIKAWYEIERKGLGRDFAEELDRLIERIREMPLQFPDVHRGFQRALFDRFPYAVYFRWSADSPITIFAVIHQRPRPTELEQSGLR